MSNLPLILIFGVFRSIVEIKMSSLIVHSEKISCHTNCPDFSRNQVEKALFSHHILRKNTPNCVESIDNHLSTDSGRKRTVFTSYFEKNTPNCVEFMDENLPTDWGWFVNNQVTEDCVKPTNFRRISSKQQFQKIGILVRDFVEFSRPLGNRGKFISRLGDCVTYSRSISDFVNKARKFQDFPASGFTWNQFWLISEG